MSIRQLIATPAFLRRLLLVDGLASGATALLLLAGADVLAPMLGLPAGLLRAAGAVLVPFVLWVLLLSRRSEAPRGAMTAVVIINFAWVAASAWVAFGGLYQPTAAGIAFVGAQGLAVLAFAELGWMGLRATNALSRTARQIS
jgi:hypothetical protein